MRSNYKPCESNYNNKSVNQLALNSTPVESINNMSVSCKMRKRSNRQYSNSKDNYRGGISRIRRDYKK